MADFETEIHALVANDKLEEAAKRLNDQLGGESDLRDEVTTLRAELKRFARDRRRQTITYADYNDARRRMSYTLLEILDSASVAISADRTVKLFLSYNHAGEEVAKFETGHALGTGAVLLGDRLLVGGHDGTLHQVPQF